MNDSEQAPPLKGMMISDSKKQAEHERMMEAFASGERQGIERAAQVAEEDASKVQPAGHRIAEKIRAIQSDKHWLEKHDAEVRSEVNARFNSWISNGAAAEGVEIGPDSQPPESRMVQLVGEVSKAVAAKARLKVYEEVRDAGVIAEDIALIAWANERIAQLEREASGEQSAQKSI